MERLEKIILDVWEYNRMIRREGRGRGVPIWPCLVGPHGEGKTSLVYRLAERTGLPLYRMTLQGRLPEDINSYPNREDSYVRFLPIRAFKELAERPGILFIDEMDKPLVETLSTILSILTEGQITEELFLHPDAVIICGMQPSESWLAEAPTLRDALASRLIQLPVVRDFEFVSRKWNLPRQRLLELFGASRDISTYIAPMSSRTLDWVMGFISYRPGYITDTEALGTVLQGIMPADCVSQFIALVRGQIPSVLEVVSRSPEAIREAMEQWPAHELVRLFPMAFINCPDYRVVMDLWGRIVELDESLELMTALADACRTVFDANSVVQGSHRILPVAWYPEGEGRDLSQAIQEIGQYAYEKVVKPYLKLYKERSKKLKETEKKLEKTEEKGKEENHENA